jgi:hypothetical protein
LTAALTINAAKNNWLRTVLDSVSRGSGFFGYLKSSSGSFMLGFYSMMGFHLLFAGLADNSTVLAIVGAALAGVGICAHNFLPSRSVPKGITE